MPELKFKVLSIQNVAKNIKFMIMISKILREEKKSSCILIYRMSIYKEYNGGVHLAN
uniref:Uncharacterized protein n=1 Tax=Nelumbo nucifera TaxID=4432 RepID=A0A822XPK1_NELNU|nr:TPA_asm: hypothetical protein HUJ06_019247 [Nelumbo nucifera]DAD23544.1 TPA_asm: hypothetical protein HUJ06_025007 [Nelumbo nucifera]